MLHFRRASLASWHTSECIRVVWREATQYTIPELRNEFAHPGLCVYMPIRWW